MLRLAMFADISRPPPARQRRMFRHGEIQVQHRHHQMHEGIGLPQRQTHHRANQHCRFDG
jgi:hypothetical protein